MSEKINEIEAELRKIGYWKDGELKVDLRESKEDFCSDKIPFEQWLQFVFIPNVRTMIKEKQPLPDDSMVGVKAMREWDYQSTVTEALPLINLLSEFDDLVTEYSVNSEH